MTQMFPDPAANLFYWVVLGLIILLVVVVYGPRKLVRQGHQGSVAPAARQS